MIAMDCLVLQIFALPVQEVLTLLCRGFGRLGFQAPTCLRGLSNATNTHRRRVLPRRLQRRQLPPRPGLCLAGGAGASAQSLCFPA